MLVKIQNVSIHVQNEIRVHLLLTAKLSIMNQNAHAQMDSLAPHLQTAGHVSNIFFVFLGTDMVKALIFVIKQCEISIGHSNLNISYDT